LNCDYCYMFNLNDTSYKSKPKFLSVELSLIFLDRVHEYLKVKKLTNYSIILHGGEPSLWPLKNFRKFVDKLQFIRSKGFNIKVSLQTNGLYIPNELLKICYQNNISMGVSVDGPKEINDNHRIDFAGKGSYDRILKNINRIRESEYSKVLKGFLIVVDPLSDPIKILDWVETLPITNVDLLWPIQFNHNNTPWQNYSISEKNYAQFPIFGVWFYNCFEEWIKRDNNKINIRFFYDILHNYFGSKSHTDNIVNDTLNMFVVNTDGNYEYHDYFRSFADGVVQTDNYIQDCSLEKFSQDNFMLKLLNLSESLPEVCKSCKYMEICGGGFLPGRMDDKISLNKKSILCYDHYYFYENVNNHLNSVFTKIKKAC
jgi:uncharacterized protein